MSDGVIQFPRHGAKPPLEQLAAARKSSNGDLLLALMRKYPDRFADMEVTTDELLAEANWRVHVQGTANHAWRPTAVRRVRGQS